MLILPLYALPLRVVVRLEAIRVGDKLTFTAFGDQCLVHCGAEAH